MKVIYYKGLIADDMGLTPTERILYSFLLNKSINTTDGVYNEYGEFDGSTLSDYDMLELPTLHQNELSKKTNVMSQGAISLAYKGLEKKGFIDLRFGTILHNGLFAKGYFTLFVDSGLRGELLIFYSWLRNLSKGNPIISSMSRIAELYHVPMANVRDYFHRLREKDLLERNEFGNLIVK